MKLCEGSHFMGIKQRLKAIKEIGEKVTKTSQNVLS
jgi:hypothetical protein